MLGVETAIYFVGGTPVPKRMYWKLRATWEIEYWDGSLDTWAAF